MGDEKSVTINVHGGQLNLAQDQAVIHAMQHNGTNGSELNDIVQGIMKHLSEMENEEAQALADAVDIAKEELSKSEPKKSRLRSCVTLLAPMVTIANGIPELAGEIKKLIDFITLHIR